MQWILIAVGAVVCFFAGYCCCALLVGNRCEECRHDVDTRRET